MHKHTKSNTSLAICSLNINRSNAATHTAMNAIAKSQNPPFNILLVQEPWWEKIHTSYRTVSFMGWQVILPKRPLREREQPQVAAYHRQGANIEIALRNDIITDPDIMILDARRESSDREPTCIINIYNQKALGEHQQAEWTIDRLARVTINHTKPMIITSDWNIRHPDWDDGVSTACPRTRETLKWIKGNRLVICNEHNVPTREDSMGHASVIDLTFKNAAANGAHVLTVHSVAVSLHHGCFCQSCVTHAPTLMSDRDTMQLSHRHA